MIHLHGLTWTVLSTLIYSLTLWGVWMIVLRRPEDSDPDTYADLEEMAEAVREATPLLVPHIERNELLLIRKGGDVRKRLTVADWPRLDEHIAEAIDYGTSINIPYTDKGLHYTKEEDSTRREEAGKPSPN